MNEKTATPSRLRRLLTWLRTPSKRFSLLTLLGLGFFGGVIFWGGFNTAMEMTNTRAFCISCHEMRDNVYVEYKETIHFTNRTGVQAICSDCHVPRSWGYKVVRKIQASKELWGHMTGYVDTKEKFESHRLELATHEWERMKANDSRECRNCHGWEAMASTKQRPAARAKHAEAQKNGGTCIDCHKGIAHLLPADYVDPANDEE
jgi:cytochrome c-type protein NapC